MHNEEAAQEALAQRNGTLMLVKGKPAAVEVTLCASSDMNLLVPSMVGAPGQIALGPASLLPQLVPAPAGPPGAAAAAAPHWAQEGQVQLQTQMQMVGRSGAQTQTQVTGLQNANVQAAQNAVLKAKAAQSAQSAAAGNASQLNPSAPSFVPMAGVQMAGGEQLLQLQQPVLMEQSPGKGSSPQQISPHTDGSMSHPLSPQLLMPQTAFPGAAPVPVAAPSGPGAPTLFAAPGQPIMGPNGHLVQPIIYFYATTIPPTPPMTPPGHLALPVGMGMPTGLMPLVPQPGPPPPQLVPPVAPHASQGQSAMLSPAAAQVPPQQAGAQLNFYNMIIVREHSLTFI